ncbi:DUF3040 domain-containing protein [Brevibacterium gallinarum]|nr:DUF3040 domain-containing protein [Brevibacterium gallinarum]
MRYDFSSAQVKGATMPLSEHEQQLLDQLEQQLRSEDPRFAQNISQPRPSGGGSVSAKRFVIGVLGLLAGIAITIASIYFFGMPFGAVGGVIGFAVMVAGGYWAVNGGSGSAPTDSVHNATTAKASAGSTAGSSNFMDRLEDRWEKRRRGE